MIDKIIALTKKDFQIETSYKLAFLFNFCGIFFAVLTYFYINKLFGSKASGYLAEFGVDYFAYVLLSMAFFSYIGVGIGSFSSRIRHEQLQGTLESLLITPTKAQVLLLGMAFWNLIIATIDIAVYIALGIFLFKINFSNLNILSSFLVTILTIISLSSLGIISASFIIIFKRGNPVGWLINTLEGVVSGVYFPITVMPDFLQAIAKFFPITHAIRAIELAVYKGYSIFQLKNELFFLLIFSACLIPLSLHAFKYALNKARLEGTLVQY
ncbi:MAG: ABC transporter permease [Candidatus Omnitrophica bacterium]|nr:ABC transporter permease [Candidatus Omnitrophota bacterium]